MFIINDGALDITLQSHKFTSKEVKELQILFCIVTSM